ncbi:hypothetical protein LTV02_01990 [Nocardia yamanashiensis]|uniref:hypothetical protein n=1 Tax=Nocardia yamanashiensis TaxID=209247 RepID=UPI0008335DC9|nr:hypothetical protein [Nocardia yamanashiensis]UGT42224.1 hypothetical protein LTV02_01990 [Nocardia yamanashiensis]
MNDFEREVRLSAVHVHWSDLDDAFVAHSDQYPGVVHHDHWSSLAAVNGLIDRIREGLFAVQPKSA